MKVDENARVKALWDKKFAEVNRNNRDLKEKREQEKNENYDYAARSFAKFHRKGITVTIPRVPWHEE